ncbi:MAG: terminase [Bacteroidetes bacterium]|jgi:hypothetical protein|nr:terminase [Bacteroidota bacterium]
MKGTSKIFEGSSIVWKPLSGSQSNFLQCTIFEALFEGTRGSAKTDALIMDYLKEVGKGYGGEWRGILFRNTYKQLEDIIAKTKKWFWKAIPNAIFNESSYKWKFPGGETLSLRHMDRASDYWNYHGHEYPWIGWEELTNWGSLDCYESMFACCRSSHPNIPKRYRSTTNPYGKGHNAVKERFIDPGPAGTIISDENGQKRIRIHGSLLENHYLLENQPEYVNQLMAISDENKRKAWLFGDWDIVAGGALDDVWDRSKHVIKPFDIPPRWRIDRSFDWGSSKPYSVGFWAESDGTDVTFPDGARRSFPRGTLFRIAETYGWNGRADQGCRKLAVDVARNIVAFEKKMGWFVHPGPADTAIYARHNGPSIAEDMLSVGVRWTEANKSGGSREQGLEMLRKLLSNSLNNPEESGLYVFDTCSHFIRTVPVLPRSERNPEDVDTTTEDHIYDETRYRLLKPRATVKIKRLRM